MLEWFKRLFSGFNFGSGAVIGKWIFYLCVFAVFMFFWTGITGKKTTTNQRADTMTNPSYAPQQTFGCMHIDVIGNK